MENLVDLAVLERHLQNVDGIHAVLGEDPVEANQVLHSLNSFLEDISKRIQDYSDDSKIAIQRVLLRVYRRVAQKQMYAKRAHSQSTYPSLLERTSELCDQVFERMISGSAIPDNQQESRI